MNSDDVEKKSRKLAKIFLSIDTDYRGDVLYRVGELMMKEGQAFTGNILASSGLRYGLSTEYKIKKVYNDA